MSKNDEEKKPRSPIKDIILSLILIVASVVLFIIGGNISANNPKPENMKIEGAQHIANMHYIGQAMVIVGAVALLLGLYFLFWFIKTKFGDKIGVFFSKIAKAINFVLEWLYLFICKILGIDPDRFFARGKDKRSFRRRKSDSAINKLFNYMNRQKYKDMQSNLDRVRFLYKKFIQKVIKKGYKFKYAKTPVQVREEIAEEYLDPENGTQFLVDLYVDNRYARPENIKITDEDVNVCKEVKS